jgi:hypothetical protein
VVLHVDDEEVAVPRAEAKLVREVEGGRGRGAAVAGIARLAGAGDQSYFAVLVDPADALAGISAIPDRAVGPRTTPNGLSIVADMAGPPSPE